METPPQEAPGQIRYGTNPPTSTTSTDEAEVMAYGLNVIDSLHRFSPSKVGDKHPTIMDSVLFIHILEVFGFTRLDGQWKASTSVANILLAYDLLPDYIETKAHAIFRPTLNHTEKLTLLSEAMSGSGLINYLQSKPSDWQTRFSPDPIFVAVHCKVGLHTVPYIHGCTVPCYGHGTRTVTGLGDVPTARHMPYTPRGRFLSLKCQQKRKRKPAKKIAQEEDKDEDDDEDGDFSDSSSGDESSSESESDVSYHMIPGHEIQSALASSKTKSMTHAKKKARKATVEEVEDSTRGIIMYYDLRAHAPLPKLKLYLPVRLMAANDLHVAKVFSGHLKRHASYLQQDSQILEDMPKVWDILIPRLDE
ncbi:hypothetical protein JB92DRAFT_3250340 [Gautieria morchelliformis]|nr:hypothetical protein JB92DRAFT_3250340 [Gautieria morchelliformis]